MKLILLIALAIVATANAGSLRYTNDKKMLSTLDKVDKVLNKEINALTNAESHRFQTDDDAQPATHCLSFHLNKILIDDIDIE